MAGMGRSGRGRGQPALNEDGVEFDSAPEETEPDSDLDEIEVGWWPTPSESPTWRTYAGLFVLGVLTGIALVFVCVFALVWVLWTSAIAVGPVVALIIWLLIAAPNLRPAKRNPARVWFLAGFAVIPCFYGIMMSLGMLIEWLD